MDIGGWLRGLGLGQYEAAFRDNEIDLEVLPKLTSEDLKEIGVVVIGHRRKLLAAIGELTAASAAPVAITKPPPSTPAGDTAERRQLTVMFCDLVGSTALTARLDPEDMRGIIGAYHKCCGELIAGNGGFVAKYMGDGVLAYFGYPQAHEHDAERAVQAGLAIVEAAPRLETAAGSPLHVRVGIATGIVVVGDLLGSGEAQERGVVGDTPNLAARLQGIAEPDSVIIADGTRKLLGNLFELADLGAKDLKGIPGSVRTWAALRANPSESRFEALHTSGLTALVGREEETELLLRRWTRAKAGEGQVVLLSGEAGIGKSRLTAALMECLAAEPHTRLRYFCSPQHPDSALYPIIGHMERAAKFAREDDAKTRLDKIDALLAPSATSGEDTALLAEMLSLANDGRYPASDLTPQQRRQKTLEALVRQIEAIARRAPVLMIFEDVHWADPSSLEVLSLVVDKVETLRALAFVTFRPEFAAPWIGRPHVTPLTINRLTRRDVEALIDSVAGNKTLPANIRQDIVERADGIPLFVEEMTKAILEAEGEGAAARTIASVPSPALAVPASLHASLMARLDRLGEAKAVAQIGAAIGREFSHPLLAAVGGESEAALNSSLERLVHAGLLYRQGSPPNSTYIFKHALVQDAAYGTLLREPRRALHARIAEVLEDQFPDIAKSQPELLARHCAEAGLIEKAASLWGKAGQRSLARSALREAEAQFKRAIDQITALPGATDQRRQQIKLQIGLANALMLTKGYVAPETKAAFEQTRIFVERAEALGEPLEEPMVLYSVLRGFWMANVVAFKADTARELAAQCLSLAEKQGAAVPLMVGHRMLGVSLLFSGDLPEARAHFDRAIALYNPVEHRPLLMQFFGTDSEATILSFRASVQWMLGHPEAARADKDQALRNAREIGQSVTLMMALNFTAGTHILLGNYAAAKAQADEIVGLADEKAAPAYKAHGMACQGCALAFSGQASKAVQLLNRAIAAERALASTINVPYYLLALAKAHGDLGQFDDARRSIGEAMTMAEASGEKWWEAELHRAAGEIELLSPERDAAKAQAYFERALEIARAQQAKSWELRAAMSMARLWRNHGKKSEAHNLLAPVYGWFTEGFNTLDLKEAKALLDELRT
jgi:class 3 adenylate cyclase/predicted ATPase